MTTYFRTSTKKIKQEISSLEKKCPEKFRKAVSSHTRYRKLFNAYSSCFSCGYEDLLEYSSRLSYDTSWAGRIIYSNFIFQGILGIAQKERENHPKVNSLVNLVKSWCGMGKNALIFSDRSVTNDFLREKIKKEGFKTESIRGGSGKKNMEKMESVFEDISLRKIDLIISTPVSDEGISIPEIDAVIYYSVPPNEIKRIQRSGRTGRIKTGNVIFICLDHSLEKPGYFSSLWKMKKMEVGLKKEGFPRKKYIQKSLF